MSATKNLFVFKKLFSLAILGIGISGCTIEPVSFDRDTEIKGAPDWVNVGSTLGNKDGERIFIGVSSARRQGDMALQKSVADDNSMAEVAVVLSSFLESVSNEYMNTAKTRENAVREESVSRQLTEAAERQVQEGIARQIEESISRQFKEKVSPQFKDDVKRQIKEDALRPIRETVSSQIEFSHQLEEIILQQIKVAVSRQIKSASKASMVGARIVNNWRDPKTGIIWSVSELDMKHVKSTVTAAKDMNADLKEFFDTNVDAIFDRAIAEKNNISPYFFK